MTPSCFLRTNCYVLQKICNNIFIGQELDICLVLLLQTHKKVLGQIPGILIEQIWPITLTCVCMLKTTLLMIILTMLPVHAFEADIYLHRAVFKSWFSLATEW